MAQAPLRLDLNEAPQDADEAFRELFVSFLRRVELRRYPAVDAQPAREAAARLFGWSAEGTLVGNGSNEVLAVALGVLAAGAKVLTLWPSFSVYPWLIRRAHGQEVRVPLHPPDFRVCEEELHKRAAEADVLLLCSPNNPTGGELPPSLWRELLSLGKPTIWDGAYWEFGTGGEVGPWLSEFPNLMVTRTLSKVWGAAGVRAGCLLTSSGLARTLSRQLLPFAPGVAVWAAFEAAAALPEVGRKRAQQVVAERARQLAVIAGLPHLEAVPSRGNFYLLRHEGWDGEHLAKVLGQYGVAVRVVEELSEVGYVRVTVGTPEEGSVLLDILKEVACAA